MKKIVIAALLSAVSGAALATEVPAQANMVFEGKSAEITPHASVAITGENGAPLATGTLNVNANGSFTTRDPVMFEIRSVNRPEVGSATIGDISTSNNLQMRYSTIEVIAGTTLGAVTSENVTVALNSGEEVTATAKNIQARDGLYVSRTDAIAGYVAGETVKTTVAVLVTSGPATTPEAGA